MSRVLVTAGALALVLVVLLAALWAFQRHLIYLPHGEAGAPADVGLHDAEEVTIATDDGLDLVAWHVPGDDPAGAILITPGNAGNRSMRAPLVRALADLDLAVLLLEYRGFGGNLGRPSAEGLVLDARAGGRFLVERHPDVPFVLYGESIGAGVAVGAVDSGHEEPHALVLRSPFPDLAAVGEGVYPWLPVRTLLRDRYPVAEQVRRITAPILVLAGADDELVPPQLSEEVAAAAPNSRYAVIAADGHNDPALLAGEELVRAVAAFLDDAGVAVGR